MGKADPRKVKKDAPKAEEADHRHGPAPPSSRAASPGGPSDPDSVLSLQNLAGNRAVTRVIQAKLEVGAAGDRYEQEADRVADQVVARLHDTAQRQEEEEEMLQPSRLDGVQRQPVEEEEEMLQPSRLDGVQRQPVEEEEEMLQPSRLDGVQRQEEEEIQLSRVEGVQRQPVEEEEEMLQPSRLDGVQRQEEEEIQLSRVEGVQRQPVEEEEEMLQPSRLDGVQRQEEEEIQLSRVEGVQRQPVEEEEEMLQPSRLDGVQRQEEEEIQLSRVEGVQRQPVEEEEELLQPSRLDIAQRQPVEEEEEMLQASAEVGLEGGPVSEVTEGAIRQAKGRGAPLDDGLRTSMEDAFGTSFTDVRVHHDHGATDLNRKIQSKAFTTGSDIFVRSHDYDPKSEQGQRLLAHELTHVVQQRGAGTDTASRTPEVQRWPKFLKKIFSGQGPSTDEPVGRPRGWSHASIEPDLPVMTPTAKAQQNVTKAAESEDEDSFSPTRNLDQSKAVDLPKGDPRAEAWTAGTAKHPLLAAGNADNPETAVRELQQKMNNWMVVDDPLFGMADWIALTGVFDTATEDAVKEFQKANGLTANGEADNETWNKIDELHLASSSGHFKKEWGESDVGGRKYGMTSEYTWRITDSAIIVDVPIDFTWENPASADNAKIQAIMRGITKTWNVFDIVNDTTGERYELNFNPTEDASAPTKVELKDGNGRSDAGNWYMEDPEMYSATAPHEFGHMIGLEDEYQRGHTDYKRLTGEDSPHKSEGKIPKKAKNRSKQIWKALKIEDPVKRIKRLNSIIVTKGKMEQGQFADQVARSFSEAHPGYDIVSSLIDAFPDDAELTAKGYDADASMSWFGDFEWSIMDPFTTSNQSLMGLMGNVEVAEKAKTQGRKLKAHEHPIQPRHVREFVEYLADYKGDPAEGGKTLWVAKNR